MSVLTVIAICSLIVLLACIMAFLLRRERNDDTVSMYGERSIIITFLVIGFSVIILFFLLKDIQVGTSQNIGQIGDFIGGITNPLLSFAALVVLLRSTLIQTKSAEKANAFMAEQQALNRYESFRSEFNDLLDYIENYADKHIRSDDTVAKLLECHTNARLQFEELPEKDREKEVRKIVVDSIEHKPFERFALAFRRVVKHIRNANVTDDQKYDHIIMLIDALSVGERKVLLNWAYFYWGDARRWLPKYPFTRGIKSSELVLDEIYKFYGGE